jgi:hypothetical protein
MDEDEWIILEWILKTGGKVVEWIHLAQDRDQWNVISSLAE